jgi:hypothetical protein
MGPDADCRAIPSDIVDLATHEGVADGTVNRICTFVSANRDLLI